MWAAYTSCLVSFFGGAILFPEQAGFCNAQYQWRSQGGAGVLKPPLPPWLPWKPPQTPLQILWRKKKEGENFEEEEEGMRGESPWMLAPPLLGT